MPNENDDIESQLLEEILAGNSPVDIAKGKLAALANKDEEKKPFELDELTFTAKPIMSEATAEDVYDALTQYSRREVWRAWGMHNIREQGQAILLEGPPGTGKTAIAKWIGLRVKKGFKRVAMSEVASGDPGVSEEKIVEFFKECAKRKNATIFVDEADSILISRTHEVEASWQLGVTNTMLNQIGMYQGLVICATNLPILLDPALERRFLKIIHVRRPDRTMRLALWRQKIPSKFPFQPAKEELAALANFDLSGAQIENAIINCAQHAICRTKKPSMKMMTMFAQRETKKSMTDANKPSDR